MSSASRDWIPVALSDDIPPGAVIPAWIPSGNLALWRTQSGLVSASNDRCPHRGMRLSHGFVRGEILSCIYHGWGFERGGACKRIPAHPDLTPPDAINCGHKPVVDKGGLIWVCAADEATANEDAVQTLEGFVPLRSLQFMADIEAIERASGSEKALKGMLALKLAEANVRLLMVDKGLSDTLVFVLIEQSADTHIKIAVSRAIEVLRSKAEALTQSTRQG